MATFYKIIFIGVLLLNVSLAQATDQGEEASTTVSAPYAEQLNKYQFGHHKIKSLVFGRPVDHVASDGAEGLNSSLDMRTGLITASLFDDTKEFKIKFTYYRAHTTTQKRPLVIDLPPIIGTTPIDQTVAMMLGYNGVDVILPELQDVFTTGKSLEEVQNYVLNLTVTMQLLIQHISQNPDFQIDQNRIGTFGVSLGAVLAASFVGVIDEVKASYVLAGGGNMEEIVRKSNQGRVVQFNKFITQDGAINGEALTALLKNAFPFDPLIFAERAKQQNKKIFMVMCKEDTVIPYTAQLELWNAYGRPKQQTVSYFSHLGTIIQWYIKSRYDLIKFIKE